MYKQLFVALIFYHPLLTIASTWKINPGVELREVYTDNVRLSAQGTEESELVSEIKPGVIIEGKGARTNFYLDYYLQSLIYQNETNNNGEFHQLSLALNRKLVGDILTVDANGRYDQQAIQGQGGVAADNIFLSSNRTDVASYRVSPKLLLSFPSDNVELLIQPSYTEVNYQDVSGFDSKNQQVISALEKKTNNQHIGWRLSAQQQKVDFETNDYSELKRLDYGVRIPVGNRLEWQINGGREINLFKYGGQVTDINDTLWNTGLEWSPSRRFSLESLYGRRFFGKTFLLKSEYRSRYARWSVNYSEELHTSASQQQLQLSSEPQPGEVIASPISSQSLTNELFVLKNFRTFLTYTRGRSAVNLNIRQETREFLQSQDTQEMRSILLNLNRRVAPRTELSINSLVQNNYFSVDHRNDAIKELSLVASRKISRRTSADVSVSHTTLDSDQDNFDYTSNLFSVNIHMTL